MNERGNHPAPRTPLLERITDKVRREIPALNDNRVVEKAKAPATTHPEKKGGAA